MLSDELHLVDLTVTSNAADTFGYMHTVVEVHVIRKLMNSIPFDRLAAVETLAHGCKQF